nr:N-acetylglucosamine-6-phosphate deacetylase [Plesiomonas shigelloides]
MQQCKVSLNLNVKMGCNMPFSLHPERVFTANGILNNAYVVVDNGQVTDIRYSRPSDMPVIELSGKSLLPGFIDMHIHGRAGHDVMDASPEALQKISHALLSTGVVAWVGTTVTAPWDDIVRAIAMLRQFRQEQSGGARLVGSFLEGPYFTEPCRGSHPTAYLKAPLREELSQLVAIADGSLLRVAMAAEFPDAPELTHWLVEQGIKVSVAHSDASFVQTQELYEAGMDCGVHLFNGMRGLHHREPGCCGALLYHQILCELIADGVHVHPVMMQLAYRMNGYQNIALITDCMRAGGLPDGDYVLGAQTVSVSHGEARTRDGSLAGSTCSLDHAVRNMIFSVGIDEWEAVQMATAVPARYLKIDDQLGDIAIGKAASFAVVDHDFHLLQTMLDGEWVFIK